MRSKLVVFVAFVLMFVGAVAPFDTQVAQAGGGGSGTPWLRVYQIDPRAVEASTLGSAVAIAFDAAGLGTVESIEMCHTPGGCTSSFRPGYYLGGYDWGSTQIGWSWAVVPTQGAFHARAVMTTTDGRRELISAEPVELQLTREASGEVWTFIDQSPARLGEPLKLRIERDLGLPVIRSEICLIGSAAWTCMYEDDRDWRMLLNGSGTQKLDLVLSRPNIAREGPRGKLISFPNGASVRVRYTMVDGSAVSFQSDPLFFP